jgi:hypothetical protein
MPKKDWPFSKPLARIIHEGTESGSLGGVCALRMVVAA